MESNYSWYYRRNYRVASISSTGHLILVDEFIKLDLSKDFMEMFNVVINWERLWRLLFYTSTN